MSFDEAQQYPRPEAKRGRYEQESIDNYVESVLEGYQAVTRERDELRVRVASLESELSEVRGLERELRDTLFAGQRVAKELRESGQRERDEIVKAAHAEATDFREAMANERQQMEAEIARLRDLDAQMKTGYKQFLVAALELLDKTTGEGKPKAEPSSPEPAPSADGPPAPAPPAPAPPADQTPPAPAPSADEAPSTDQAPATEVRRFFAEVGADRDSS
jgi:cell division septum initiation protein DivIVA